MTKTSIKKSLTVQSADFMSALCDLAIDASVARLTLGYEVAPIINLLFINGKAKVHQIVFWHSGFENMELASKLGYHSMIRQYGAKWLADCNHFFRDDPYILCYFNRVCTPIIKVSYHRLPYPKELWGNDKSTAKVLAVQANQGDLSEYHKCAMVVSYENEKGLHHMSLNDFVKYYQKVNMPPV